MTTLPLPRRSFLDSRLRCQSHETRRLSTGHRTGDSHLGHGPRTGSAQRRARFRSPAPRAN